MIKAYLINRIRIFLRFQTESTMFYITSIRVRNTVSCIKLKSWLICVDFYISSTLRMNNSDQNNTIILNYSLQLFLLNLNYNYLNDKFRSLNSGHSRACSMIIICEISIVSSYYIWNVLKLLIILLATTTMCQR